MIEINFQPTNKQLRIFGITLAVFAFLVGGIVYHRSSSLTWSASVTALIFAVAAIGLLVPRFLRIVYVTWMVCVFPIGWIISHTVMALVYYLLFTPIGFFRRTFFGDPLTRKLDRSSTSYWHELESSDDKQSYFRQF